MPRRARKAQCYLLDLPQALGSTRWLNPRELLSLQTLPHGSLNCHVVSVSPLLSAATALFKGKFEEYCGFFVERRHFEMCKMSWENGSCGALGESRPFPINSYPLHFSTSVALLARPSVWARSIPLKSLYIPYKPQRRRKTLNVLSVLLDWEVKILALQGWPSCRPAPPARCWCLVQTDSHILQCSATTTICPLHYLQTPFGVQLTQTAGIAQPQQWLFESRQELWLLAKADFSETFGAFETKCCGAKLWW